VFRRDRYNLKMLTTSILSIVRELDDRYAFREEVDIADEVSLNRSSFDVFGDALFVLIGNAAKHGKADGLIKVLAQPSTLHKHIIRMDIVSEMASPQQQRAAVARIQSALTIREDRAIDSAAVGEGFSGLRKLLGLLRRVRSPHVALTLIAPNGDLRITFRVTLPAEINSTRDLE
jgi:hypothetical protein